jgi:cell wall-associated NlpC family hydrolase
MDSIKRSECVGSSGHIEEGEVLCSQKYPLPKGDLGYAEYISPSLAKATEAARSYVGAKWRHRGRQPWALDCIGLVVMSLAAGGVTMVDRKDYGRQPWRDGLDHDMIAHFGSPLSKHEMQAGDVALLRWDGDPAPSHVGLIVQGEHSLHLIHAYSVISVTEHRIDTGWLSRIDRVYRPKWGAN